MDQKLIQLRGENKTVTAIDTLTFRHRDAGTEVTYAAEFTFKGPSRLLAPLLRPAFERLGNEAAGRHAHSARPALTNPVRPHTSQRRAPVGLTDGPRGPSMRQRTERCSAWWMSGPAGVTVGGWPGRLWSAG